MRRAVLFAALLVAVEGRAACRCPLSAFHTNLLITAPAEGPGGVVACGIEESRKGKVIRGSEVEVFRCDHSEEVISFDGTQTVTFEPAGDALRIIEYANAAFGKHFKWIEVPVAEWRVDSRSTRQDVPRPRLPRPEATKAEIRKLLRECRKWIADPKRDHKNDEEMVGRLFAAMVAGDPDARQLFQSMKAFLDGAAGEEHLYAEHHYNIGVNHK